MRSHALFVAATLSLAVADAHLCAQNVLVVDATGGPGSQFTDLPPAVQAAMPGDVLDVRPGTYAGFTTSKGIHVLGQPGVRLLATPAPTRVENLPAGESFTLRNVEVMFTAFTVSGAFDCAGSVAMENVIGQLHIERCDQVHLTGCSTHRYQIIDSDVAMNGCLATVDQRLSPAGSALYVTRSTLVLSRCHVSGNNANPGRPTPAITLDAGALSITEGSSTNGRLITAGGASLASPTSAIVGTGTVRHDPRVTILGSFGGAPVDPGIPVTVTAIPSLAVEGAGLGGTVQLDLAGNAGDVFLLAIGVPSAPVAIRGLDGEVWIDAAQLAGFGILPASGQFSTSVQVPNLPRLLGLQIGRQAITGAGGQLSVSNPAPYTIRL